MATDIPSGCQRQHDSLIKRRIFTGFTLIELLVVIAIIAILAAILFPVFSQAKKSAKKAATISNAKQISLSMLMYTHDYDDQFVIAGEWGSADTDAYQRYPSDPYMPWTGIIYPYLKNQQILQSPITGATAPFMGPGTNQCSRPRECALLYPNYGYNATFLSPSWSPDYLMTSFSATAVERPSDIVMITEIWSRNLSGYGAFTCGLRCAHIQLGVAASPNGVSNAQPGLNKPMAVSGWGKNWVDDQFPNPDEGLYTGGVAFRYAGRTPTVFTDGHVKMMSRNDLAVGTNWVYGVTTFSQVKVLMQGTYRWNPVGTW